MARKLKTGEKRRKIQEKRKKLSGANVRGPGARHPLAPKPEPKVQRAKHVPKQRTPKEFAKLSPAQQLYARKGIVASSEEGAIRQIEEFKRKALAAQPPAEPAPVQGPLMEGGQSIQPEVQQPKGEKTLFQKATAFGPDDPEEHPLGSAVAEAIAITLPLMFAEGGITAVLSGGRLTSLIGGGSTKQIGTSQVFDVTEKFARGAAHPLASKLGSIENLKLAQNSMNSKVLKAAAGQIPSKLIRKEITNVLARDIAMNTVNAAKTFGWLTKAYHSTTARAGAVAVGGAMFLAKMTMDILGTYPFAGFIPEESIQMLGMDSSRAIEDVEWKLRKGEVVTQEELDSIERTLAFEREILSPDAAESVIGSVPIKNVVDNLYKFYEGAGIVNENKETRFQKIREQVGPDTEDVDW